MVMYNGRSGMGCEKLRDKLSAAPAAEQLHLVLLQRRGHRSPAPLSRAV